MRSLPVLLIVAVGCSSTDTGPAAGPPSRAPAAEGDYSPARFADPGRVEKLRSALPEIDALFSAFAKANHVPGIAWGVIIDGKLSHTGTAGLRDVEQNAPVDSASVFRIASMTKSFTALSILKLRDEGKLSLDDPAERYVPELSGLSYPTADSPRLTIRHLLSHSEGFPEDNPWGDQQLNRTDDETFDQQGIYAGIADRLDDPSAWSPLVKVRDGGEWYPQVMGVERGSGTDKTAGQVARFFMAGRSDHMIQFDR